MRLGELVDEARLAHPRLAHDCRVGVAIGQQLHRALEVGEEHSDLLALTFQGALGSQNLFGEVLGGIGLGRSKARLAGSWAADRRPALVAELGTWGQVYPA